MIRLSLNNAYDIAVFIIYIYSNQRGYLAHINSRERDPMHKRDLLRTK